MSDEQHPNHPKKADELLEELESIKSLLDDDIDSIPVLEEMIDDAPPLVTKQAVDQGDTTPDALSILPGQQGLFDETAKPKANTSQKSPSSDNPFLPKHIRERLGSSSSYVEELEQQQRELEQQSLTMPLSTAVPSALDRDDHTKAKSYLQKTIANPDELIDSLVKQYLPIIEDELRQQLKKLVDKN